VPLPGEAGEVAYRDGALQDLTNNWDIVASSPGAAIVRMGCARVELTGEYSLIADNGHGKDQVRITHCSAFVIPHQ
jgi:hypothetical protein